MSVRRIFDHGVLGIGDDIHQNLEDMMSIRHDCRNMGILPHDSDTELLRLGHPHQQGLLHQVLGLRRLTNLPRAGDILLRHDHLLDMVDFFHEGVDFALDGLVTPAQGLGNHAQIGRNLLALRILCQKCL